MNSRRRRLYLDGQLQGRLLLALVSFETLLFASAWLFLYRSFAGSLAAAGELPKASAMAAEMAWVVLVCCLVNALVLTLAHFLWTRRVRRVVAGLEQRLQRIDSLDLRPDPAWNQERCHHRVIDLCDRWIEGERRRMLAVRIAAARLPRPLPTDADSPEAQDALAALQEAARLLRRTPDRDGQAHEDTRQDAYR